jgi:hypothetical protein
MRNRGLTGSLSLTRPYTVNDLFLGKLRNNNLFQHLDDSLIKIRVKKSSLAVFVSFHLEHFRVINRALMRSVFLIL